MPVQQIYCTHCTYGTSVLELRVGDVADRVLGYSARAASVDRQALKGYYRQIERFLNYYLPADTPPEEKSRLDASSAPRRFFFYPALGNLQMVGHVCYRQSDTAGRIGSYFAHVLFAPIEAVASQPHGSPALAAAVQGLPSAAADASASAVVAAPKRPGAPRRPEKREDWPVAKCLQLWDAPWVVADSPELPLELPPLESLESLWNGASPVLNDELLVAFLQTPADGDFSDPASIIPERWRAKEPAERADLLVQAMQGLLDLGSHRRDNVLLVVEPSVAALVFYGIARLVPPAVLTGVSFSTYEPSADRLAMTVAATTFFSPETSDVRPDLYRRRGFVWNTYTGRMSDTGRPLGDYARFIIDRLVAGGWQGAERLVRGFADSGVRHPEELATLVGTHRQVDQILSATPLPGEPWRSSPVAEKYLRDEVRRRLADAPPGWPELHAVAGSPNHLPVLELVACEAAPTDLHGPALFLLRRLPPEKFPDLLASPRIAESAQLDALQHYVTSFNRLPDSCQSLWSEEVGAPGRGTAPARPLLEKLLARLPEQVLSLFRSSVPDAQRPAFLRIAMRAGRIESRSQAAIKRMVLEAIVGLDDVRLVEALTEHGDALRLCCPPPEPALGKRLHRILYDLPEHPTHFSAWLDALSGWTEYFSDPGMAEQRLGHWRKIRAVLHSLRGGDAESASGLVDRLRKKSPPVDYRGLAEELGRAMPMASYPDDAVGKRKQAALLKIGTAILNRSDVLPDVVWSRMSRFFEYGDWNEGRGRSGKKRHGKKRQRQPSTAHHHRRRNWLIYGLIAAGAIVLMVAVGWSVAHFRAAADKQAAVATTSGDTATTAEGADTRSPTKADGQSNTQANPNSESARSLPPRAHPVHAPQSRPDEPPEQHSPDNSISREPEPSDEPPPAPLGEKPSAGQPATNEVAVPSPKAANAGETPNNTRQPAPAPNTAPPPPGELPKPSSASEKPDDEETAEFVTEHFTLPSLTTALLTAYDPVVLKKWGVQKWEEAPKSINLSLIGLDFVNEQIGRGCRLIAEPSEGELHVKLKQAGAEEATAPRIIATFRRRDASLTFQWIDLGADNRELNPIRDWLRGCVLEIESRPPAGDETAKTANKFYTLVAPAHLPPLPFSNGAGHFDQSILKPPPLPPLADGGLDLVLGPGHIFARDGKIFFGLEATDVEPPYELQGVPERFNVTGVEIDWSRDEKHPSQWHVEIGLPDDDTIREKKQFLADNRQLLSKVKEIDAEHAQPLRDWIKKKKKYVRKPESTKINSHISALAEHLKLPNPPRCPDETNNIKELNDLRDAFLRLANDFSESEDKLMKDGETFAQQLTRLRKQQRDAVAPFTAEATSVSATIYRRVDAHTFAAYAVLGNPEEESTSAASSGLNHRAGFDDGDKDDEK